MEFLAVAGEYFFERPKLIKKKHPELYRMLETCFCLMILWRFANVFV
ncbi:zinc-dependent peptidase [Polaribacter glomeratus]|nr:zinc-dependent peptidase [Polaribacter glomeratus]